MNLNKTINTIAIKKERVYSLSFFLFFLFHFSISAQAQPLRLEAENALLSGGGNTPPQVLNDPNCSGGKYVDTREGNLTFSCTIADAGYYAVSIKTKSPYGDKINLFRFDGENAKEVSFPQNNSYTEVEIIDRYYFAAGTHSIEMIKTWGWIHFDYLEISPASTPPVEFDIQALVTPQAATNTRRLYQFLLDNFQQKIISGVMTLKSLSTLTGNEQNEIAWLYEHTGKKPALLGLDFMDHTGAVQSGWRNNPDLIADAVYWKNQHGIVALCWHWRDPSHKTSEFYTERTTFDPRKIFEPASNEYTAMMRDLDLIAGYLKELQAADVPVLWRPLHEAAGGWFWWGSQGPEACRKIWQIMFDKFTNEHQLNNLIWVWTSEANSNALNWYPGDEYVDVIGMDIYDEGNHGSQMLSFEELKKIYNGKKLLTLSECGSLPGMASMKRDQTVWSYYMPWYGAHTKTDVWNSVSDWTASLSDPDVITLDEMPENLYVPVEKIRPESFVIYATNQQIHIHTPLSDDYQLYLYDFNGKRLLHTTHLRGNQTISVSGYPETGLLVTVENKSTQLTQKIKFNRP